MQVKVISSNDKKIFQDELQQFLTIIEGQEIVDIKFSTSNDRGHGIEYSALILYHNKY
ncbi:sporulation protein Cse60 [Lysinibacillus yapensis]|uniref:Sporulation protein Cse60 n=1 Tax=Ureibacillus yapensis TaxID=2304605 RepID=A0A396SGV4_9BACL|nr:sporulation protein Cse60 [Lysinibacillus yapensis]RHW39508.1 sporulation protein Cse60 [Lysinibacillus yapensis]